MFKNKIFNKILFIALNLIMSDLYAQLEFEGHKDNCNIKMQNSTYKGECILYKDIKTNIIIEKPNRFGVLFDNQTGTAHFGKWSDGDPQSYLEPGQAVYFTPENLNNEKEMTFDEELANLNGIFKSSKLAKFPPPIIFYDKYWEYAPEIKKHIANNKINYIKIESASNLQKAYVNFITVRDCREIRKDYKIQYITISQFEQAKKAIKSIENDAKRNNKDLDSNKIWDDAVKIHKEENSFASILLELAGLVDGVKKQDYNEHSNMLCGRALTNLIRYAPQIENEKYKKDF